MEEKEFQQIIINKNRGWRGLAEALVRNNDYKEQLKIIFSFSSDMWTDLTYHHKIVVQDQDNYYVINFSDPYNELPKPTQQRSVLIKSFAGKITSVNKYSKASWFSDSTSDDWTTIKHFIKNRNNHTTSDWNCIGIRVMPEI